MATVCKLLVILILRIFRLFLDLFSEILFRLIYRNKKDAVKPIEDPLLLQPAISLARKIRKKEVTSVDVVKAFIKRIQEVQPIINAVADERFRAALDDARVADELIRSGKLSEQDLEREYPFLGIPFSTKESIANEGMRHTDALLANKDKRATRDAEVVKLMKKAGAIPLAVTNVPELCMWIECDNYVYGRSCNPYDTTRIVGGSSGGEGALIASGGSVIGIGSDIAGSIRIPSFFNGIFGHKPSTRIVSNDGQTLNEGGAYDELFVTGPMCRYAADLVPMYKVLAAKNISKLNLDQKVDISRVKVFYMLGDGGNPLTTPISHEMKKALKKLLKYFEDTYGKKPVEVKIKNMRQAMTIWSQKMATVIETPSFASEMGLLKGEVNLKLELLKWAVRFSNFTLPCIGYGIYEKSYRQRDLNEREKYVTMGDKMRKEFEEMLGENGIFLYPTYSSVACFHGQSNFKIATFAYTTPFNAMGFPVTQCPLGLSSEGLPLGVQVVAGYGNDHVTLSVALELEKAFGGWRNPQTN